MTGQQTGDGQPAGNRPRIAHDCGRAPDPQQYGLLDRIAVALFPILEGRRPDREAGE